MPQAVQCACGKSHEWSAAVAGTRVRCDCGADVAFPPAEPAGAAPTTPGILDAGADGLLWSRSGVVNVVLGVVLVAMGCWMHVQISSIEQQGRHPFASSSGVILRPIYAVAGRWGVVGVLAAAGVLLLLVGVAGLKSKRRTGPPAR